MGAWTRAPDDPGTDAGGAPGIAVPADGGPVGAPPACPPVVVPLGGGVVVWTGALLAVTACPGVPDGGGGELGGGLGTVLVEGVVDDALAAGRDVEAGFAPARIDTSTDALGREVCSPISITTGRGGDPGLSLATCVVIEKRAGGWRGSLTWISPSGTRMVAVPSFVMALIVPTKRTGPSGRL
ncbi:MAG: hypothetical protein AAF442_00765 [Pseudomonadota bacterium]